MSNSRRAMVMGGAAALGFLVGVYRPVWAQTAEDTSRVLVLAPDAVWDGVADAARPGWVVVVM